MSVTEAIAFADSLLPGTPSPEGQDDPRWQAIIEVGHFIVTAPEAVWKFVRRWGVCPVEDVRDAIASCLLEHLLEHHFATIFPKVEKAVEEDALFADTFSRCWTFGQAKGSANEARFDQLKARCRMGHT